MRDLVVPVLLLMAVVTAMGSAYAKHESRKLFQESHGRAQAIVRRSGFGLVQQREGFAPALGQPAQVGQPGMFGFQLCGLARLQV